MNTSVFEAISWKADFFRYRQSVLVFAWGISLFMLLGGTGLSRSAEAVPAESGEYQGPEMLVVSHDGATLFVANADARQIAWIDLSSDGLSGKVVRRLDVPGEPTGIVLTNDGETLYATCAAPESSVVTIDVSSGNITATIKAGHTARAPVLSPDNKVLYVCNRFNNAVSVFNLTKREETARIPVVREPFAAGITPDGKTLVVANHLPNTRTDVFYADPVSPKVTLIDTQTHEKVDLELPFGSASLRGVCISPDGRYAYITHILSNFVRMPTQLDLGWTNLNVMSVIDTQARQLVNTVGLDRLFQGAGNPWGIACTADGKSLVISHAGSCELSIVDTVLAVSSLPEMYVSPSVGTIVLDPREAPGPKRIKLPGKGPRGLALHGSKVYVAQYFDDDVAVVDLSGSIALDDDRPVKTIALGPKPKMTVERWGEMLFHDSTICYQHWQSCASCHPDARSDAINWDLLNDGGGNPKNTKSMLLSHRSPPAMAEGVRATAEVAVRSGIVHILFSERPEEEAVAIDRYLESLKPVASPYLVDGRLSEAAERGKRLFESNRVSCRRCHPAPLYTDLKMHDVGTRLAFGTTERFDTPTLVEVWRTAPYLHDGRHTTIRDLLVEGAHGLSRSQLEELSKQDIDDLAEFVLSL